MSEKESIERLKTTGRNDKCPCGSGKKYKKCHLLKDSEINTKIIKAEEKKATKAAEAAKKENEANEDNDETNDKKKKLNLAAPRNQSFNSSAKSSSRKGGSQMSLPRKSGSA